MGKNDQGERAWPCLRIVQFHWHTTRARGIEPLQEQAVDLIGAGRTVIAGGLWCACSPVHLDDGKKSREYQEKQCPSHAARTLACIHLACLSPCSATRRPS